MNDNSFNHVSKNEHDNEDNPSNIIHISPYQTHSFQAREFVFSLTGVLDTLNSKFPDAQTQIAISEPINDLEVLIENYYIELSSDEVDLIDAYKQLKDEINQQLLYQSTVQLQVFNLSFSDLKAYQNELMKIINTVNQHYIIHQKEEYILPIDPMHENSPYMLSIEFIFTNEQ